MLISSKVLLVEKYDISQRILKELVNVQSRKILFSIIGQPKSIQEIIKEQKIPISSAYKRIAALEKCALINTKLNLPENGHKTKYYQSKINDIEINIAKFEPKISIKKNELMVDG